MIGPEGTFVGALRAALGPSQGGPGVGGPGVGGAGAAGAPGALGGRTLDTSLSERAVEHMWRHFELLTRWGKVHNLTNLLDPVVAARDHYADCWRGLAVLEAALGRAPEALADVGSGAGFPGLVAAMRWPEARVVLIEPAKKRVSFLEEARRVLGLPRVEVVAARVEDVDEAFPLVTSRATQAPERGYAPLFARVAPGGHIGLFVGGSLSEAAWVEAATAAGLTGARLLPAGAVGPVGGSAGGSTGDGRAIAFAARGR